MANTVVYFISSASFISLGRRYLPALSDLSVYSYFETRIQENREMQKHTYVNLLEMVELIAVEIKTKDGNVIIANVYMPSQTGTWGKEKYRKLVENTKSVKLLLQNIEDKYQKIISYGYFSKNVSWENMKAKSTEDNWDNELL